MKSIEHSFFGRGFPFDRPGVRPPGSPLHKTCYGIRLTQTLAEKYSEDLTGALGERLSHPWLFLRH